MELFAYVMAAAVVAAVVWLTFLGTKSKEFKEVVEDIKEEIEEIEEFIDSLPSPSEVKKMTKAKLVELASKLGIEIDPKSNKAVIVEEIEKLRK